MNVVRYPADKLTSLLRDQKVATMPQLKSALGTSVTFTVLRKLAPLGYRSSYSHGGTYYTLDSTAHYNELGLWSYRDIHFSRHGTLLNTAATWCSRIGSTAGSWRDAICIVRSNASGVRNNGLHGRRSNIRTMSCGRPLCSSTVCWTSSNADSTPGWKAWSGVMAAINEWPSCSGWMWILSPVAERSC
jgi:hypothetical protein